MDLLADINIYFLQAVPATKSLDVIGLLMKGGVVMLFLALLSVAAIFLIIERLMFMEKNLKINDKMYSEFIQMVTTNKKEEAAEYCSKQTNSWGRIFLYGVVTENSSAEELDHTIEEAANVEVVRMEKGLNYLSMIAGIAPLLGFIGTIIGVITIFYDISIQGEITIPVISEGLYTKMVSSASGLVVGIIAFSAHHLFQNRIDSFIGKISEQALNLKVALKQNQKV